MRTPEKFSLSREDPASSEVGRDLTVAMINVFGPAIAGSAREYLRSGEAASEPEATISAVHSAVSSIVLQEAPEAAERHGLVRAVENFDRGFGMTNGFPMLTSVPPYHQEARDFLAAAKQRHRRDMLRSRYTVTLGQATGALLPFIDACDERTAAIFEPIFPHRLDTAFSNIWSALLDQITHVERFDAIMDSLYYSHIFKRPRKLPLLDERDIYNQNYVMTEADVRRIFSAPIAMALHENVARNGTLKTNFALSS